MMPYAHARGGGLLLALAAGAAWLLAFPHPPRTPGPAGRLAGSQLLRRRRRVRRRPVMSMRSSARRPPAQADVRCCSAGR